MNSLFKEKILKYTSAQTIIAIDEIQELWSGFGKILRIKLEGGSITSVIVKYIDLSSPADHPRGWNTSASFNRKSTSYAVEQEWYKTYAIHCDDFCRVPKFLGSNSIDGSQILILEDLNESGFPFRKESLTKDEVKLCLSWLAHFHAKFMGKEPINLWKTGTYWYLDTRKDEFMAMEDSELKTHAAQIDTLLNNCQFKTIVHGDAKVANFCFTKNGKKVSAVDFQYVGAGCGIKDVIYLLSSCLTHTECTEWEGELLEYYFHVLESALNSEGSRLVFNDLETEWRKMYPIAWADFSRFLLGWMPTHKKLNAYSYKMVNHTLKIIKD